MFFHVSHMPVGLMGCDRGGRFKYSKGTGEGNIMQDGVIDLQHETGGDGNLHPCMYVRPPPQVRVFMLGPTYKINVSCTYNTICFSPLQVKN